MFTYGIWEEFVIYKFNSPFFYGELESLDVFVAIIISLFTLPLDILLLPFEIISIIIYKILEKVED